MLLLPKKVMDDIKDEAKERAKAFVDNTIEEIAGKFHSKLPLLNEFWILIAAKRDARSGHLNAYIKAVDRDHLHKVNHPIQGAQLWYINWKTGEKRLEWILPLQPRKSKIAIDEFTQGNKIIQESLKQSEKILRKNLATGK